MSKRNSKYLSRLSQQRPGTGRLSCDPVVIAGAEQLFATRSLNQNPVLMAVALKICKLIAPLKTKSRKIAASKRYISHPKRVSFCCVIALREQRALFSPDAGVFCSHAGDPVSHVPLVHATRTLPANADAHVQDLFSGRDVLFYPSATVHDCQNYARVPAISPPVTRPVSNKCALVRNKCEGVA